MLKPTGSTFAGSRRRTRQTSEFLASTDPWFRPVQALTGPDGGLWVADMYRYLIEHPRWIPPADLAKIDVRAGAGLGRIYRVRPDDEPPRPWPRLDKLDTAGLVAALDSPNGWQRDMAMMMLVWRKDDRTRPCRWRSWSAKSPAAVTAAARALHARRARERRAEDAGTARAWRTPTRASDSTRSGSPSGTRPGRSRESRAHVLAAGPGPAGPAATRVHARRRGPTACRALRSA